MQLAHHCCCLLGELIKCAMRWQCQSCCVIKQCFTPWQILSCPAVSFSLQLEKARLDSEAAQRRMEAEAAQARVAVAQAETMYKSERAQWVTSLDAQKFEVGARYTLQSCSKPLTTMLMSVPLGQGCQACNAFSCGQ